MWWCFGDDGDGGDGAAADADDVWCRNDGRETVEVETTSPEEQSAANGVQLDAVSQSPPATSAAETTADTPVLVTVVAAVIIVILCFLYYLGQILIC